MKLDDPDLDELFHFRELSVDEKVEVLDSLRSFLRTRIPVDDIIFPLVNSGGNPMRSIDIDPDVVADFLDLMLSKLMKALYIWKTQLNKIEIDSDELKKQVVFSVRKNNK